MHANDEAEIMMHVETDFTALDTPILRDPIYLSPEEEELYVRNNLEHSSSVDFTDSDNGESIMANDGWTWYADNKEKDKFGYIADGVSGGQHIAISLTGGRHGIVEVSFVVSYENFGTALAWLDTSTHNKKENECNKTINKWQQAKKGKTHRLFASWEEKASVPKVDILKKKLMEGEDAILHVCLTPKSELVLGTENRFKLLGVRVY